MKAAKPIKIQVRQAGVADTAVVARFNRAIALETEDLKLDPATVRRGVRTVLGDPARGIYYVAEVDGQIAGQTLITTEWSDWRNAWFWWIQSVYVAPEFRGGGVFDALFAHLQKLARRRPGRVCGMRLYMDAHNHPARKVYERLGFKKSNYELFEWS